MQPFRVAANTSASARSGTISVAGQVITITQAGFTNAPILAASSTHGGDFYINQTGATYITTVTNNGPLPTSGTVTVVSAIDQVTVTAIAGTGWNCVLATLTCTRPDVSPAARVIRRLRSP